MSTFTERMIRAARLDRALYEEVEADETTLPQAMGVVLLSSVAAGIGVIAVNGAGGLVVGTIGAFLGWYVWAVIVYLIGTKLLPGAETKADIGQLLRTTGFSASPGILRVAGIVPGLGSIVFLVAVLWMLAAMIVAVRQALDYESTGRAVAVCVIGFLVQLALLIPALLIVGPPDIPAPH